MLASLSAPALPMPLLAPVMRQTRPCIAGVIVLFPVAHAGLGESLRQWGRSAEAVSVLERAVELSPGDPKIRFSLARSLSAVGRPSESLAQLEKVLELDSEFAGAYQGRGVILEQRGEAALALESYRRALELDPTRTELVERIERLADAPPGADDSAPYVD